MDSIMKTSTLAIFAVLTLTLTSFAIDPPPDGGYPNQNTAEGEDALLSLTTGASNTAIGFHSLYTNSTGYDNTAVGMNAMASNTFGVDNTAVGINALLDNSAGQLNV